MAMIRFEAKGTTMLPDFPAGAIVEAREVDASLALVGDAVFVKTAAGATFKRLVGHRRGKILLRDGRGHRRYSVNAGDVVRMAVAEGIIRPLEATAEGIAEVMGCAIEGKPRARKHAQVA